MKFENNRNDPVNQGMPVLIVDDDYAQRALQSEILQSAGLNVKHARCGKDALEMLANESFDLVLLDKGLPDMDGDQVTRLIREDLGMPLLPIIMVTGKTSSDSLQSSLQSGANDFVRKPYDPDELLARVGAAIRQKQLTDQLDSAESVIFALARMVEVKDSRTAEHCIRLARSCQVFGHALGMSDIEMDALSKGAVLHDVGKVGIPDNILLKPGRFNDQEWDVMKRHPVIGSQLCNGLNGVKTALPIILHHHERWDGSGYPHGLGTNNIPRLARVFQLVDIYDALLYERPYNEAHSITSVISILEDELKKGWRDPELTGVFLDILRSRPADLENGRVDGREPGAFLYQQILGPNGPLSTVSEESC